MLRWLDGQTVRTMTSSQLTWRYRDLSGLFGLIVAISPKVPAGTLTGCSSTNCPRTCLGQLLCLGTF
jgi:hypothetical protein